MEELRNIIKEELQSLIVENRGNRTPLQKLKHDHDMYMNDAYERINIIHKIRGITMNSSLTCQEMIEKIIPLTWGN